MRYGSAACSREKKIQSRIAFRYEAPRDSFYVDFAREGELLGVEFRFAAAGLWRRVRHRPGAILEFTVAVVTFVGVLTLASLTSIRGLLTPTMPLWVSMSALAMIHWHGSSKMRRRQANTRRDNIGDDASSWHNPPAAATQRGMLNVTN